MLENLTWSFFEKTGNVETYLEYINIKNCNENRIENSNPQQMGQE